MRWRRPGLVGGPRVGVGDGDQRRAVEQRVGDAVDHVGGAGSARREAHAGAAGDLAPGRGQHGARHLLLHQQEAHLPLPAGLHQLDQLAAGVADDERRARLLEGGGKHLDGRGHARSSRFPILAAGRCPCNLYETAANVCGPSRNWPRRGPSPKLRAQRKTRKNRGEAPMRKTGLSLLTALAAAARARGRRGCAGLPHQARAPHHSVPAGRQQRCGRAHDRHAAGRAARQAGGGRQSRRGGRRPRHRGCGQGAAPDGYTILVVSLAYTVNPWLYKLKYDPLKSFVPVAMLASGANVLTVHPVRARQLAQGADRARQAEARASSTTLPPAPAASSTWARSSSS